MKNILEKTVLSAIAGLALTSAVGCSTMESVVNYEAPKKGTVRYQENAKKIEWIKDNVHYFPYF